MASDSVASYSRKMQLTAVELSELTVDISELRAYIYKPTTSNNKSSPSPSHSPDISFPFPYTSTPGAIANHDLPTSDHRPHNRYISHPFPRPTTSPFPGANQGIGYETAKSLLSSPTYHILLSSRSLPHGEAAVSSLLALPIKGTVSPLQLDVTSEASIASAATHVRSTHSRIDVLINNAGIVSAAPAGVACLRETLATNTVGAVAVTEAFKALLTASASPRLLFVTSSLGSLTHASNPSSPYCRSKLGLVFSEYRVSKAATNMAMIEYGKALAGAGVRAWGVGSGGESDGAVEGGGGRGGGEGGGGRGRRRGRRWWRGGEGGGGGGGVVKGGRDAEVGRVVGACGVGEW